MATLVFPQTFEAQVTLANEIAKKHKADGSKSILAPYFIENPVDFTAMQVATVAAGDTLKRRNWLKELASKHIELRDHCFNPVLSVIKEAVQSVKKIYGPNPRKLADWGINIDGKNKIVYPSSFTDNKNLVTKIIEVHLAFAAGTSPMQPYITANNVSISNLQQAIADAVSYDAQAQKTAEKAEQETELFTKTWQPHVTALKGIGSYLMKVFVNTPRKLVDWGFSIDDSTTKAKEVTSKLKLGEVVTLKSMIIGGTLRNTGKTDVHLYKGTSTKGNPIIIKPGEEWGVPKGYSVITLSNPDSTQAAEIKALRSR